MLSRPTKEIATRADQIIHLIPQVKSPIYFPQIEDYAFLFSADNRALLKIPICFHSMGFVPISESVPYEIIKFDEEVLHYQLCHYYFLDDFGEEFLLVTSSDNTGKTRVRHMIALRMFQPLPPEAIAIWLSDQESSTLKESTSRMLDLYNRVRNPKYNL